MRLSLFPAIASIALAPFLSAFSLAQATDDPAPPVMSSVVEEVEVRRIQFPILARHEDGSPVTDLRLDELQVSIRGRSARAVYLDPARSAHEINKSLPRVRLSLEGGEMSVAAAANGRSPRAAIFFIDGGLPTSFALESGPGAFATFIGEVLEGADLAAVFSFGEEFRLESAFTSNKARLAEAVKTAFENRRPRNQPVGQRMRALVRKLELCIDTEQAEGQPVPSTPEPSFADPTSLRPVPDCLKFSAGSYVDQTERDGLRLVAALEETLRYARGLDGPVTIYALTHGATLQPEIEFWEATRAVFGDSAFLDQLQDTLPQGRGGHLMRKLAAVAENERVSFAFVDPSIVPAGHISAALHGAHQGGTRPVEAAYRGAQRFARDLARETGGVFLEERDVLDGLREIAGIEGGRYYLGVAPPASLKPSRRITRVSIRCTRPGVSLNYGRGAGFRSASEGSLRARIALPRSKEKKNAEGRTTIPFTVGFRAAELAYETVGKEAVAEMTLHLRVETPDGRLMTHVFHDIHHVVPKGQQAAPGILTIRGQLEAPAGEYRLIAFLRSLQSELRTTVLRELRID